MIRTIARAHRLNEADTEDVCQTVWLQLFRNIERIVEPRAISGWLATTAKNSALAVLKSRDRTIPVDSVMLQDREAQSWENRSQAVAPDDDLLQADQRAAVQESVQALSTRQLAVLGLLAADPPVPYVEISRRLGVPIGSIGPTRARSIQRLRQSSAVRALVGAVA